MDAREYTFRSVPSLGMAETGADQDIFQLMMPSSMSCVSFERDFPTQLIKGCNCIVQYCAALCSQF